MEFSFKIGTLDSFLFMITSFTCQPVVHTEKTIRCLDIFKSHYKLNSSLRPCLTSWDDIIVAGFVFCFVFMERGGEEWYGKNDLGLRKTKYIYFAICYLITCYLKRVFSW